LRNAWFGILDIGAQTNKPRRDDDYAIALCFSA
jgi:hypothetical protein